jgi:GT2 family glycosyltransferase
MSTDVVVVLHYRGLDDTLRCISSVLGGDDRTHVIVVDNGSGEVRQAMLPGWADRVTCVELKTNAGFTGGMNHGIDVALAAQPRTVTVLNNDTVIPVGAITRLAEVACEGARLVSPEIRRLDDPDNIWFGGGVLDKFAGLARHLNEAETVAQFGGQDLRSVDSLTGCCLTASTESWRTLAGFDPFYFLMFEDSELSVRARRQGYDLLVVPDVRILHAVSASFYGPAHELGHYYYARNGVRFVRTVRGCSTLTQYRFLRYHVLPSILDGRHHNAATSIKRAALAAVGVIDAVRGRGGPAPAWLRRWVGVVER